jgi:Glycine rich protein
MDRRLLAGTAFLAALIGAANAHAALVDVTFPFSGAVVDLTIGTTGVYQITADGAQGGAGGNGATGGLGALASG